MSDCRVEELRLANEALVVKASCAGSSRWFRFHVEGREVAIDASALATQSILLAAMTHGHAVDFYYWQVGRLFHDFSEVEIKRPGGAAQ